MTRETEQTRDVIRRLAAEAATVADAIKDIDVVDGETWVSADGIANDLAALEAELWKDAISLQLRRRPG